jgi:hypothetical protein
METRIAGIPCTVDYTIRGKYKPAKIDADPDSCYEADYPEIEFTVCDRRGRPALWLANKLIDSDIQRIESEILQSINSEY